MDKPVSIDELVKDMDPALHESLKKAVELGRWANGDRLTPEQVELCLQAVIAYEHRHVPEAERVGFIDRSRLKKSHCDDPESEN